jgi:transposase
MSCRTYELKIDRSHLSEAMSETLNRLFLEAKWFYNGIVSKGVSHADYKNKVVEVLTKERKPETRVLQHLSSQMRQSILERARWNIAGLAASKQKGRRVGKLRFKSRVNSIQLKQYGPACFTFELIGDKVRIQNIKQLLRVRGLGQIPTDGRTEVASAILVKKQGDYFIHVSVFQASQTQTPLNKAVGIDVGVRHQLTLSNGLHVDESVPVSVRVRKLHMELSRRRLHSRNWFKTNELLNKEYNHLANQRADIRHKIVSRLVTTYYSIAFQDDNISGWQRMWGRRIATSAIGGIMSDLRNRSRTPFVVKRIEPTTQRCSTCGTLNEVGLDECTYHCRTCHLQTDRDLNSAVNDWKEIPAERRELTPVDTKTATELLGYFNGIPNVSASLVEEAGSRLPVTEATVT